MSEQSTPENPILHVVFAGLCMLVRDEGNQQLHVLLPTDHEHAGHAGGPEKHVACLIHDAAYGCTGTVSGEMCKVGLDGVVLDLSSVGGEKPPRLKVAGVVDEGCMGGRPVPQALLTATNPTMPVKSRISLASGGVGQHKGEGAYWALGECKKEQMATWVEWVIRPELDQGKVKLQVYQEGVSSILELTPPVDGDIYLYVFHVPKDDIPNAVPKLPLKPSNKNPKIGGEAKHFRAFYPLIGRSSNDEGPRYKGPPNSLAGQTRTDETNKGTADIPGFDYGCMMATARAAS